MNEKDLFRALGDIDDDLIEEAGRRMPRRRFRPWMGGLAAACLCMAVLALRWNSIVPKSAEGPMGELRVSSGTLDHPKEMTGQMWSIEEGLGFSNQPADAAPMQQAEGFCLTWPGGSYDSASGVLTEDNVRTRVLLTQAQQETILALADEAAGSGEGSLTRITAAGERDEPLDVDSPAFSEILNILHGQD